MRKGFRPRTKVACRENHSCCGSPLVLKTAWGKVTRRRSPLPKEFMSPRNKATAKAARTADVVIPERLYFRIGEVAELCQLPAYVLRFWETEFPQIKPIKSSTGQRMYRRKDVESVLRIKKLLYEEGFTIAGARQHLRAEIKSEKMQPPLPFPATSTASLKHIRQSLRDILSMLSARA